MEKFIVFSGEIKWVISVGLEAFSIINYLSPISIKDSPFSGSFSKRLAESLSYTINIWRIEAASDLKIVFAKDKLTING